MTKRLKKKRIAVARTPLKYLILTNVFWVAMVGQTLLTANAQTDFDIKASSPDLKSEFQKELDKWMLRAYEGDRDAQFKVGVLFANDQFGPPDYEQAAYWYRQAARQSHPLAQYNLGHQFLTGNGVKRDETAAMQWWLKAAEQEHALAQFNVGRAYYLGIGLNKDLNQSRLWFERASQNNEPKSTELLKQLGWWESEESTSLAATGDDPTSSLRSKIEPIQSLPSPTQAQIEYSGAPKNTASVLEASEADPDNTASSAATTDTIASNQVDVFDSADASAQAGASDQAKADETSTLTHSVEDDDAGDVEKQTLAVFTNPAVRSVLITLYENAQDLTILDKGPRWTTVSAKNGFPVWVHSNFINVDDTNGVITATSVNARSVPLITQGSVVGRLDRGDRVTVLGKRNDWYRIYSPSRFKAWAKTEEISDYLLAIERLNQLDESNYLASDNSDNREAVIVNTQTQAEPPVTLQASLDARPANAESGSWTVQNTPVPVNLEDNQSLLKLGLPLNDNTWLFSQPDTNYTLQLASFSETEPMVRFVNSLSFKQSAQFHLFNTKSGNDTEWVYATYGSFNDKEAAKAAVKKIGQSRAWIRKLGVLQEKRCLSWKKQVPAPNELNKFCK